VTAVAALSLAACSGTSPNEPGPDGKASGDVTIVSWRYADPSAIGQLHSQLVEDFNASQDAITVTAQPVPYPDVTTTLINSVLSGSVPEMSAISPGTLASTAEYLEPLDEYWEAEGPDFADAFTESSKALATYDGHIYGIVIETSTTDGMYYNKGVLAEAGVDPEQAVSSWDAFTAALEKIKAIGKTPMIFEGKDASRMDRHWSWYVAGGADLSDPDTYIEQMCSADSEKTFEFLSDLYLDGLTPNPAAIGYEEATRQFAAGNVGFYTDGPWGPTTYAAYDDAIADQLGYTHLPPKTEGGPQGAAQDGYLMVIPKGSKNPAAAWEFMKYMASPEAQVREAETGNLPTLKEVNEAPEVADDPVLAHFADLMTQWGYPRPRASWMDEFKQDFITAYQAAVTGQKDPATAHADVCAQVADLAG